MLTQTVYHNQWLLRGYIFQKLLIAWSFNCINKNCFFIKETDTFGHIVVCTIYTSHINNFSPQHAAFEQSTACLSVVFELLPGFIPFAISWHAGWNLEKKNIYINMNCNYPTTIWESIFAQMYNFLVEQYIFPISAYKCFKVKSKNCK